MGSTNKMREDFWNTLCSLSDYSVENINKLNATFTIPDTLCRFRSVNTNTLWQLQENTQFFSTANYYDDPFDTYFKIDFQKLQDVYKLTQEMLSTGNVETIKNILSVFNITDVDGLIQNMAHSSLNLSDMNQSLSKIRNAIQSSIWSICFCENPLNETMWLKYANHHTGFVVTYNFNDIGTCLCGQEEKCKQCGIVNNHPVLYPVYYSEEKYDATWYALGLMILANVGMNNNQLPPMLQYLIDLSGRWQWQRISLIKKECHHYDEEWRLLSLIPYYGKLQIKLKPESVIIGLKTPQHEQDLIISAAKKAGIANINKIDINDDNDLKIIPVNEVKR
ncbi:MAG: DUF2971 domain-containing protein [Ruminococcus flavefaciens]|nr:DUF2971 domain-containing protein [Ruminococcus flavefaciens]